jgi:hypothetical protein
LEILRGKGTSEGSTWEPVSKGNGILRKGQLNIFCSVKNKKQKQKRLMFGVKKRMLR